MDYVEYLTAKAISTHAPRTGSDGVLVQVEINIRHFNPRSPHGERRVNPRSCKYRPHFNPRSPHGERPCTQRMKKRFPTFQPTLPARGATQ